MLSFKTAQVNTLGHKKSRKNKCQKAKKQVYNAQQTDPQPRKQLHFTKTFV